MSVVAIRSGWLPFEASNQDAELEAVIQRGNAEQVQAIAARDPSAMADSATAVHLQELQQTNQDLLNAGVTSIALDTLEWGPIKINGANATVTTYETWSTVNSDSSTQESRDENDYTLVQQDGIWTIASDTNPTASPNPVQRTVSGPAPRSTAAPTAPSGASGIPADPTALSQNWAGYASSAGTYTAVSGTWTVPQFAASSAAGLDATWLGIGGIKGHDLIQAGTQEQTSGASQTKYSAWVEALPQTSRPVPLVIRAGDSISVSLTEPSAGNWQVALINNTTGQNYQDTAQYTSSNSSAEWIEEAPSSGRGGVLPIDDFGTVKFTGASASQNGQTVSLSQAGAQAIALDGGNHQTLATTSAVGADGSSFSVTRTSTPDTQPAGRSAAPGAH